jgi:hypothetical protein
VQNLQARAGIGLGGWGMALCRSYLGFLGFERLLILRPQSYAACRLRRGNTVAAGVSELAEQAEAVAVCTTRAGCAARHGPSVRSPCDLGNDLRRAQAGLAPGID